MRPSDKRLNTCERLSQKNCKDPTVFGNFDQYFQNSIPTTSYISYQFRISDYDHHTTGLHAHKINENHNYYIIIIGLHAHKI